MSMRDIYFEIAIEWLIQAGKLDEAAALLPRLPSDEQPSQRADVAIGLAHAGEYRKAQALLKADVSGLRREILAAIDAGRVLVGDARLDV
jgi:hypothetical protein